MNPPGHIVDSISSALLANARNDKIYALSENKGFISEGVKIHGNGFVVSADQYAELVLADQRNKTILQPYIGGDDITTQISSNPARYVINFGVMSLEEARKFSIPYSIVDSLVRPYRESLTGQIHEQRYWVFWDRREKFFARVNEHPFVLVCSGTAKYLIIDRVSTNQVLSQKLKVFRFHDFGNFALFQSSIHDGWARFTSATRGDGIAYSNSDSFATFPRPLQIDGCVDAGEKYYRARQLLKESKKASLTQVFNLMNDPLEQDSALAELRRLHVELDLAVVDAYGWKNLALNHDFHETKQGIRFTISEAARREVLDRLLQLNHQRYAEEVAAGLHAKRYPKSPKRVAVAANTAQVDLFAEPTQAGLPERNSIADYLGTHPGWHSKDAILSATGFPENRWNVAIRELLDSGQVERQGEKRGARYQAKAAFLEQTE